MIFLLKAKQNTIRPSSCTLIQSFKMFYSLNNIFSNHDNDQQIDKVKEDERGKVPNTWSEKHVVKITGFTYLDPHVGECDRNG